MNKIIILLLISFFASSCSKMQEKKPTGDTKTPGTEIPKTPKSENNTQKENKSSDMKDEKAETLVKSAEDAITNYSADKSAENKNKVVAKCLAAGNYLMFEADLPPKEKYRPALKYYRKVLEADPSNAEAIKNKTQIEDIYKSMGMPVPTN